MGKVSGSAGRGNGGRPTGAVGGGGAQDIRGNVTNSGAPILGDGVVDARVLSTRQRALRERALLAAEDMAAPDPTVGRTAQQNRSVVRAALDTGVVTRSEIDRVRNMKIGRNRSLTKDFEDTDYNADYRFRTNTGEVFRTPSTNPRYVAAEARKMAVERGATGVEYLGRVRNR